MRSQRTLVWKWSVDRGLPRLRSLGSGSDWELGPDGDGWYLSQDGTLLGRYRRLDEAMARAAEEDHDGCRTDTIDRIMPDEEDQGRFHQGLLAAMDVLCKFLPAGCGDEMGVRLNQLRGKFEGFDVPVESRDVVAGLAVGMVDYCLFEARHSHEEDGPDPR